MATSLREGKLWIQTSHRHRERDGLIQVILAQDMLHE